MSCHVMAPFVVDSAVLSETMRKGPKATYVSMSEFLRDDAKPMASAIRLSF